MISSWSIFFLTNIVLQIQNNPYKTYLFVNTFLTLFKVALNAIKQNQLKNHKKTKTKDIEKIHQSTRNYR